MTVIVCPYFGDASGHRIGSHSYNVIHSLGGYMNQIRHGWAAATVLSVMVSFGLCSQSILAQTVDPPKQPADTQTPQEPADVQQLKDRVKQLEQTVDELK